MRDYYVMEDGFLLKFYDLSDEVLPGIMRRMWSKAVKLVPENPERILDMATGTAKIAIQVKEKFPTAEVYGIDLSDKMLSMAEKNVKKRGINIHLSKQNMEKTYFKSNFFDAVTIGFAMHHVNPKKTGAVLAEAKRVLKNNGKLVIIDIHKPKNFFLTIILLLLITVIENHTKPFLKSDLVEELRKEGFNNIRKNTHYLSLVQVIEAQNHKL